MSHIALDISTIEARLQSRIASTKSAISTNIKIATKAESHDIVSLVKAAKDGIIIRDLDSKTKELLCEEVGGFAHSPGKECPFFFLKKIDKGYAIVDTTFVEPTIDQDEMEGDKEVPTADHPAGKQEAKVKPEVESQETKPLPDTMSNKDELENFLDALESNMAIVNKKQDEMRSRSTKGPAIKWQAVLTRGRQSYTLNEYKLAGHNFSRRTFLWDGITYDCTAYEEIGNTDDGIIVIKESGMLKPEMTRTHNDGWARGFWNNAFDVEIVYDKLPDGFKVMKFLPTTENNTTNVSQTTGWKVTGELTGDGGSVGGEYEHSETISYDLRDWAVNSGFGKFMFHQNSPWKVDIGSSSTDLLNRYNIEISSVQSFWGGFEGGKPLPNLSFNAWQYETVYSYRAPKSNQFQTLVTNHGVQLYAIGFSGWSRWHWRRVKPSWTVGIRVKTLW